MAKKKLRVYIRHGDTCYRVATLFWREEVEDIYLTLSRPKNRRTSSLGKFKVRDGKAIIHFGIDEYDDIAIGHTSVHARGRSHRAIHMGNGSKEYEDIQYGVPLKGLKTARPLWALAPHLYPELVSDDASDTNSNDFIINEPDNLRGRVFHFIAMPKEQFNFNFEFEINKDGSLPDLGYFVLELPHYNIFILAFGNDSIEEPPKTVAITSYNNMISWITSINQNSASVELRAIALDGSGMQANGGSLPIENTP